ncbi:MAG: porin [Comamonas sp.]
MTKTTRMMLAVLAVCGTSASMAQSSVTLYGRVNTSVESHKEGDQSLSGLMSNGSFIGFKGTEDLGSGLKAGFVLEAGFNADSGSGNAGANGDQFNFSRNSELNLSGNFGTLRAGSFDPASYLATADYISMHNHDTGITADRLYMGNHIVSGSAGNKIAYRMPTLSGFNAEVQYSFGEKAEIGTNVENRGAWDLGVNYDNGPLGLGFGYSKEKVRDMVQPEQGSAEQYALRASYAIGDLTLGAYYQRQELNWDVDTVKRNAYRLAAMYTMGASEFHANVGRADKLKLNGVKLDNTAATQWTLAYNYNLSKRTKVYTFYSNINNLNGTTDGIYDVFDTGVIPTEKEKARYFGVGIRHLF